ncbi:hypothetical protein Dda_0454 [Drechslerella dactyloides]|uniref:RRN6 helical bundle domain-containing protein n=1 Tax=Drechslerella dactyloides TaxID=74499 RepID=A0AAD6NMN7_DREDA|nr:hypothetical protein Dda_0454 [Drechslerella dactyloides]
MMRALEEEAQAASRWRDDSFFDLSLIAVKGLENPLLGLELLEGSTEHAADKQRRTDVFTIIGLGSKYEIWKQDCTVDHNLDIDIFRRPSKSRRASWKGLIIDTNGGEDLSDGGDTFGDLGLGSTFEKLSLDPQEMVTPGVSILNFESLYEEAFDDEGAAYKSGDSIEGQSFTSSYLGKLRSLFNGDYEALESGLVTCLHVQRERDGLFDDPNLLFTEIQRLSSAGASSEVKIVDLEPAFLENDFSATLPVLSRRPEQVNRPGQTIVAAIYDALIKTWLESLPPESPAKTRLRRERLARMLSIDIGLSSLGACHNVKRTETTDLTSLNCAVGADEVSPISTPLRIPLLAGSVEAIDIGAKWRSALVVRRVFPFSSKPYHNHNHNHNHHHNHHHNHIVIALAINPLVQSCNCGQAYVRIQLSRKASSAPKSCSAGRSRAGFYLHPRFGTKNAVVVFLISTHPAKASPFLQVSTATTRDAPSDLISIVSIAPLGAIPIIGYLSTNPTQQSAGEAPWFLKYFGAKRLVRWRNPPLPIITRSSRLSSIGGPWSALPFGRAAINTSVLFFILLPILVLRIAQLSVISNKGLSDIHGLVRSFTNLSFLRCTFWYTLSAWLIIQWYIWNTMPSSNLSLVTKLSPYEPYRLNERPLYLSSCALPLGVIQALIHIWIDRDYIKLQDEEKTFLQALSDAAVSSIQRIGTTVIASIASGPIFYWIFRRAVCRISHAIVGSFIRIHPDTQPESLSNKVDLLLRSVWLSAFIIIAWEATNISFTLEFSKGPIREGKAISDTSPDPNGSLIFGLKLKKKPLSRRMAFKELAFIATENKPRRESIFADLSKPASAWKQIMTECCEVIGVIITNLAPPPEPSPSAMVAKSPSPIKDIKDFTPQKPLEENILRTPAKNHVVDKWQATPQNMPSSPINIDAIKTHIVKKEAIESKIYQLLTPVLDSKYGDSFRVTIQKKTTTLLPHASMQVDAITILVDFVCASLKEDIYGMIQKDLPGLLEDFVKIAAALEGYMSNPPLSWTDIHAKAVLERRTPSTNAELFPEAISLLTAVNSGLQKIGDAFDPYLDKLSLSNGVRRKVRSVREAAKAQST